MNAFLATLTEKELNAFGADAWESYERALKEDNPLLAEINKLLFRLFKEEEERRFYIYLETA